MELKKYQVFLSSTYSDLVDEREGIIKAILEMYHIPIGMEMFSAEDEDQWEIIRRTIEVSDYYILILGLRYGSKTSDDISFTQKEYMYALEKKIPILAFVMKDSVPLSIDKRDNDLLEINNFRRLVLSNSKMAQFWETKDELIKKISVSLMKQIMQKPGVGWIRGDNISVSEAISKELSVLSKENRELREKITELELKVSKKLPDIDLVINPLTVNEDYYSYEKLEMPNALIFSEVEPHLHDFISEEDIDEYNREMPTREALDRYNAECERVYRINECSTPLKMIVSNIGSAKANNVYIDIIFPEGIYIYGNNEKHNKPNSPIPFNPITRAQSEYNKKLEEKKFPLSRFNSMHMMASGNFPRVTGLDHFSNLKHIKPINQHWWVNLDGQKVTIKIEDLIHTRYMTFDDEYMMVPLVPGKYIIQINVICEEYSEVKKSYIEMEI